MQDISSLSIAFLINRAPVVFFSPKSCRYAVGVIQKQFVVVLCYLDSVPAANRELKSATLGNGKEVVAAASIAELSAAARS